MQQPAMKPITEPLHPLLRTIQATDNEIIMLQAALHHYRDYISYDKDLHAKVTPLIQHFVQRLQDQIPLGKELITTSLLPLRSIQVTGNEIIILQAAVHHYRDDISYDKDLHKKATPLIQKFIQRLHDQLSMKSEKENLIHE